MNGTSVTEEVCRFAVRLFEECGGLVDWKRPDEAGIVVFPEQIAQTLGCEESVPVSSHPGADGLCVSLATDFLEAAEVLLQTAVPRIGCFQLPERYLKSGDLQAAVDRAFTWHNVRVRVRDWAPRRVEYHTWWFHASLKSEDVWESRLSVTVNSASQTVLDLPELLDQIDLEPYDAAEGAAPDTFATASEEARRRTLHDAQAFLTRLESRLERDRKRLREYYGALLREAGRTKRRAATPPSPEEVAARKRAVNLELQRKLAELEERYAINAVLKPLVLQRILLSVLAVELFVQRKQAVRVHTAYWNPITKQFEPLRCSECGVGSHSLAFTNDDVEPVCAKCWS